MKVRPKFLRWVSILFVCGILIVAFAYFEPLTNLPECSRLGCPFLAQLRPLSKAPVQATDSLELGTYIGNPGTPYTVRIYGDGRVDRDTTISVGPGFTSGCPLHDADKHLQIPATQAIALIEKARDGGFCRLCELYRPTHPVVGGGLRKLTLTFHGKSNTVANISPDPPPLFTELVSSLSSLSTIPEYAVTNRPSKPRMMECIAYNQRLIDSLKSQVANLQKHLDQH